MWWSGPQLDGLIFFFSCRVPGERVMSDAFLKCSGGTWHRIGLSVCQHLFPAYDLGVCIVQKFGFLGEKEGAIRCSEAIASLHNLLVVLLPFFEQFLKANR